MKRVSRLEPLARVVLRTQSDDRLVSLAREGREQAFEEIVRRYRPGLVAFAAAHGARESAEDVVQESLERSWDALRESESEIHLKPWLYAIVRNRALNARRDARPHAELDEQIDGVRRPDEIVLDREEFDRMVVAIKALPDAQRKALLQSAFSGYTHEQIATALGSNSNAVGQLIWRARTAVRHGVGLVIPLPLLRAMLDAGPEAVAGVGAGGGAAMAATGGTSVLAKGATVALVGVVAAGSGIAIKKATAPGSEPSHAAASSAERAKHADVGDRSRSAGEARGDAAAAGGRGSGAEKRPSGEGHGDSDDGGAGAGDGGSAGGGGSTGAGSGSGSGGSGSSGSSGPGGSGSSGSSSGGSGSSSGDHGGNDDDEGELDDNSGGGGDEGYEEVEIESEDDSSGEGSDESDDPESDGSDLSGDSGPEDHENSGSASGSGDD